MSQATELITSQLGSSINNQKTWGSIIYNVKDPQYGAKGDGVDDTAAINRAIAAIIAAGGGTLYFPKGVYKATASLTEITVPVDIVGAGRFNTFLLTQTSGVNLLTISANFCRVSGFEILYNGVTAATSGSGVLLKNTLHTTIDRCNIHDFYINIDTISAAYYTIFDNYIYNAELYNIRVQNIADGDAGDSKISLNTMEAFGKPNMTAHIYQQSSGGLRIIGNKLLHGKSGVVVQIVDGAVTSILIINANSIELQTEAFIKVQRANATGSLPLVSITGNELRSDVILRGIMLADGTETISITGNVMLGQGTATAIEVDNTARDVTIAGNTLKTWDTGIKLNFTGPSTTGNYARATLDGNQFAEDVVYNFKNTGYIQDSAIECRHMYTNNVVAADNVTYASVFQIDLSTYSGGTLDLDVSGIVNSAGSFARRITKVLNREGAGVIVTAISDTVGGLAIDVNFDVTSIPGSVIVKVRKAAVTGTNLVGTVSISAMGQITGVKAFNTVS
jgi:hypothetical protein